MRAINFLVFVCFCSIWPLQNRADADTDGDGRTDSQELADGTDPNNDLSVQWRSLAAWRFADTNLFDDAGQVPLAATNIIIVPGLDGNGASITSSNGPVLLNYRAVEADGSVNLAPKRGSIWFHIKPHWFTDYFVPDSGNQTYYGLGPGGWATIIQATNFSLQIDPTGQHLVLTSRTIGGLTITNIMMAINIQSLDTRVQRSDPGEGLWYKCLLNYSPESTSLTWEYPGYVVTGPGIAPTTAPPPEQFVSIGSNVDGSGAINAVLDEVIAFNAKGGLAINSWRMSALASNTPPGLNLVWTSATNTVVNVKRRIVGSKEWQSIGAALGTNYFDDTALLGVRYEYNVNTRLLDEDFGLIDFIGQSITATRGGVPLEERGKLILLVDQTLAPQIEPDLNGFITNLVGDGWQVIRTNVPRHIDDYSSSTSFLTNHYNITNVIAPAIRDSYDQFTNTIKQILIIGHATIPYSGTLADDGHNSMPGAHVGAWPADVFYGDVDGIWTDNLQATGSAFAWNLNHPGDGKFDQNFVPTNSVGVAELEIPVSRIDFFDLPGFSPRTEAELLIQYLKKNSDFRLSKRTFAAEAYGFENPVQGTFSFIPQQTGAEMASKISPLKVALNGDPLASGNQNAVMAALSGPGSFIGIGDPPFNHTSSDIAAGLTSTNVAFYFVRASYSPDWNSQNNFLRAILGTTNGGLASGGLFKTRSWRADGLSVGLSLGYDVPEVINTWVTPSFVSVRTIELMGDATLRYPVLAPPGPVSWIITNDRVHLSWSHPVGIAPAYHVYRSTAGIQGEFSRLNAIPLSTTQFTDLTAPLDSPIVYMVRALDLTTTGAGTFTNISQGTFASDLPEIDSLSCCIPGQMTTEDVPAGPLAFSLGDAAAQPGLQLSGTSSDTQLVPNENIVFNATNSSGIVTITPAANQFGTNTITIEVKSEVLTTYKSFDLAVASANDAPGFIKGADQLVAQNSGPNTVPDWATSISPGPANESGQTVGFTVTTDKPYLFSEQPAVNAAGVLTFTPTLAGRGIATVSVRAVDDGGIENTGQNTSAIQTFAVTLGISDDADLDGLPDDYEQAFSLNGVDANSDADGDGFTNLQEFWAGTNPRESSSLLEISRTKFENGVWLLSFPTVQGRNYTIEYNDAFPTGTWNIFLVANLPGTGSNMELADIAGHNSRPTRIYRLKTSDGGANAVTSGYAGFWRFPMAGSAYSLLSMPFTRPVAARGLVQSISANVVELSGSSPWETNQWAYVENTQTNTYYLLITSGAMEGDYFAISENSSNMVTVDLDGGTLAGVNPGDRAVIIPYWTIGSICPGGLGVHASGSPSTRLTEVFMPDPTSEGVASGPTRRLYYRTTWREVGAGSTNKNDEIILPDMFALVRHNIATPTEITAHGSVLPSKLRIGLRRQPTGHQDNLVALPRPGPVSLEESGLVESGAFRPSFSLGTRVDELLAFPADVQFGTAPAETFFYRSGTWRKVGFAGTTNNAKVFIPGTGVILRLDPAADSVVWINSPNY